MELNEYQKMARCMDDSRLLSRESLMCKALGMGEAGEIQNAIKKGLFHPGSSIEDYRGDILDECGDLLWYISTLLYSLGFSLEDCARFNIRKLQDRYPDRAKSLDILPLNMSWLHNDDGPIAPSIGDAISERKE